MSETRFTPGPWRTTGAHFYPGLDGPLSTNVYTDDLNEMATVAGENCRANAHLIAAAPELYEALNEIWGWVENWGADFIFDPEFEGVPEKIKTALRKARGEA